MSLSTSDPYLTRALDLLQKNFDHQQHQKWQQNNFLKNVLMLIE